MNSPGVGTDLWIIGLALSGLGTILGGVNMVTTMITLRAPGMTMFRMPIFTWNILVTSRAGAARLPDPDRGPAGAVGRPAPAARRSSTPHNGGAILWQHLFWFFGHPEVYIIALPFFGIVTEIIPVFSRKPLFGYKGMVFATLSIAALSLTVWAHHMFTTGAVLLPFFSFMTFLIAVPTGIKFFNWIGTMWGGAVTFETPMLFSIGFMVTFLFGGLTGVMLASPPIDFHVSDTYFVVAHFHYVLFGTIVFAVYGGIYFWFPKFTGRYLDERLGKLHFWLTFIGFHMTFLVQHWLGAEGMPRRYADYLPTDGFTLLNTFSTIGSFVLGARCCRSSRTSTSPTATARSSTADDPWGHGNSLEWATSLPAAAAQLHSIPRIRSERPGVRVPLPASARAARAEAHAGRGQPRRPGRSRRARRAAQRGTDSEPGLIRRPAPAAPNRACPERARWTRLPCSPRSPDATARVLPPALFAALAAHDVDVRDVEQVVIRDRLILPCCWICVVITARFGTR